MHQYLNMRFSFILCLLWQISSVFAFTMHPFHQKSTGNCVLHADVNIQDFETFTVPELKDELRQYNLKVGGKKDELIQRLTEYFQEIDEHETPNDKSDDNDTNEEQPLMTSPTTEKSDDVVSEESIYRVDEDKSFAELNLLNSLQTSIQMQGWEEPTPIQKLAIPIILQHFSSAIDSPSCSSIWAEAPTGSGKTAAFALPLIQLTLEEKKKQRMNRLTSNNSQQGSHQRHLGGNRANRQDNSDETVIDSKVGVSSLILCPTRELAMQISGVIEELVESMSGTKNESVDVTVITGGVPMEPQIEMLAAKKNNAENVDILVATPGRLADVLLRYQKEENTSEKELEKKLLTALDDMGGKDASLSLAQLDELKINESIANNDDGGRSAIFDMLSNVKFLVLDEADRLLSQGFKSEMDDILKLLPSARNVANINDRLKPLLFSATFPDQIQPRVERVLRRLSGKDAPPPIRVSCSQWGSSEIEEGEASMRQKKRMEFTTQPTTILEGPASTIDIRTIRIDEQDRTQALRRLLNDYGTEKWDRVLVFVSTRYASEHIAQKLRRYHIKSAELHGKLDQDARVRRLEDFKKGKIRVLVATDLASRGLDVVGLPAVVNYDLPRSTADFTHRIGRTGRAGKSGTAVSFVTPMNEEHYNLIEKRHLNVNNPVEREILPGFAPNEVRWNIKSKALTIQVEGVQHSSAGLAHDKMFGGIKGRRKSKKDVLREKEAREAARKKTQ